MGRIFHFTFLLTMVSGLWCCEAGKKESNLIMGGRALYFNGQTLQCNLQQLGIQSKHLWDSIAHSLEQELPVDMPAEERKSMVGIRNAGLIRMFEAYPGLPASVQQKIDQAEQKDRELAGLMQILNDSLKQHDLAVSRFLEEVEFIQPDSLQSWKDRLAFFKCD